MNTTESVDGSLIAACGLFCGNCGKYLKEKCPGCAANTKATWCKIRSCCIKKNIANCSACQEFVNPAECAKYNNFISRVIEFFFSSDRSLNIDYIRQNGEEKFVAIMKEDKRMSLPKKKKR